MSLELEALALVLELLNWLFIKPAADGDCPLRKPEFPIDRSERKLLKSVSCHCGNSEEEAALAGELNIWIFDLRVLLESKSFPRSVEERFDMVFGRFLYVLYEIL